MMPSSQNCKGRQPARPPTAGRTFIVITKAVMSEPTTPAGAGTPCTTRRGWRRRRWGSARAEAATAPVACADARAASRTPVALAAPGERPRRCRIGAAPVWRIRHRDAAARPWRDVEREVPLVVARCSPIGTNRRLLTLAAHAHDAADSERRAAGRWSHRAGGGSAAGTWRWHRTRLRGHARLELRRHRHDHELAVLRHRVLVLLPQIPPIDQRLDARRQRVRNLRVLKSVQRDGSSVLLAAKHELGFPFAPRFVPPDGHRHGHQDGHDCQGNQQGRHGIAGFSPRPRLTT